MDHLKVRKINVYCNNYSIILQQKSTSQLLGDLPVTETFSDILVETLATAFRISDVFL